MAKRFEQTTGPSQRQQRVAELVRHALAEVLSRGDLQDDVLTKNVITIPEVRMSPDLKLATAYVMPLGGRDEQAVLKALEWQGTGYEVFIIAEEDTVMSRSSASLAAEVFPDVRVTKELGEHETLLSIDKAKRVLGYQPEHSWRNAGQA